MTTWNRPVTFLDMLRIGTDRPLIPEWKPDISGHTLNLGPGTKIISGATELDLPEWNAEVDGIPFGDSTISNIYMLHFLEHIQNLVHILRECQRVLIRGGHLNIVVPYWNTEIAFSDPDHKHFFSEETWRRIFDNPYYDKDHSGWEFRVGCNVIAGIVERNKILITQLIRTQDGEE